MSQTMVFKTSRLKALVLVVGAGLFVCGGFFMAGSHPWFGWITMLFFGACALIGAVLLLTGGPSLLLDEEGFEMIGAFRRSRSRWTEIESIRVVKARGASFIAVDFKGGAPRHSRVSRSLSGMDTAIGNTYNVSLKELCSTLNEWHERYGRPASSG